MDRLWWTLALAGLVLVVAAAMRWGWRNRAARQSDLPDLPAVPVVPEVGGDRVADLIEPLTGLYVSTTNAGRWQDRIVANGLGRRATCVAHLRADGVLIDRRGDEPIFIPIADVRAIRTAPGIAGKVMATPTGILVLTWSLGDHELDTGLRADDLDTQRAWLRAVGSRLDSPNTTSNTDGASA